MLILFAILLQKSIKATSENVFRFTKEHRIEAKSSESANKMVQ
jgi:hypothetical protein